MSTIPLGQTYQWGGCLVPTSPASPPHLEVLLLSWVQSNPVQSLAGSFENRADKGTGRWVQQHGDWLLGSHMVDTQAAKVAVICTLGTNQGASM